MPRDSSGNYTLPLGNPVIDGTTIDTNWANPTMSDIAVQLNNVLTRDGLLAPIGPFYIVDGTFALPGLAFASQNGSGLWKDANSIGMSYQGVVKQIWQATNVQIGVQTVISGTPNAVLPHTGSNYAFKIGTTFAPGGNEIRFYTDSTSQISTINAFQSGVGLARLSFNEGAAYIESNGLFYYGVFGSGSTVGPTEVGFRNEPRYDVSTAGQSTPAAVRGCTVLLLPGVGANYTIKWNTFGSGDRFNIVCYPGAGPVTLIPEAGLTMHLAGTATVGNRTLATNGRARLWFANKDECWIDGPGVT